MNATLGPDVPDLTNPALDAAGLAQAFQAFARASDELTQAYSGLQGQVGVLTERLDLLLAALPAAVVVVDRTGRVEQINPAARAMLGADIVGQTWVDIADQCMTAGESSGEWCWQALAGPNLVERVSVLQTNLVQGGGALVLLHDVTAAWNMRQAAARNERLAAMGEMVAGLAHQLRTPLAAALLYTGHMASTDLPAEKRVSVAERALERLRHLDKLITDMLMFARGEALGREAFGICELAAELAHTIEPMAADRAVRFEVSCSAGDQSLFGNRKELSAALLNLLENALNAVGEDGQVTLRASIEDGQGLFAVIDNGPGIDPQLQTRLFQPFFTTRADGTGLGLAIARGVARAHGGDIRLQSIPGEGSEFCMVLPLGAEQ